LLDWSANPLVAALFATLGFNVRGSRAVDYGGDSEDSAVYAYEIDGSFDVPDYDINPFSLEDVEFFQPTHITPRLPAQLGAFSIHPSPTEAFEKPELTQIVIPGRLRLNFQVTLDTLGFNHSTMFPDIDGVAMQLGWYYQVLDENRDWIVDRSAPSGAA